MILDFIYTVTFIFMGLIFSNFLLKKENSYHKKYLQKLLFFHFLIGIAFFLFTNNGGGDAWGYWTASQKMTTTEFFAYLYEEKGTYFMYSFNFIPANVLGMSFFANTMLYSLIGFVGLVFFYIIAIKTVPYLSLIHI